jgi:hypothetical protein
MGRGGSDDRDVSTDPAYRGDRIERNCTMGDGGNAARKLATLRYGKYSIISARLAWEGTASKASMMMVIRCPVT